MHESAEMFRAAQCLLPARPPVRAILMTYAITIGNAHSGITCAYELQSNAVIE